MPSAKKLRGRQKKAKKGLLQILGEQYGPDAGTNPCFQGLREQFGLPEDATPTQMAAAVLSGGSPDDSNGAQLATPTRPGTGPTAALTPNAVHNMYTTMGNEEARGAPHKPVLQVLRLELEGNGFWCLDLSDGKNYLSGSLNPSLAHLVNDSTIEQYSTVRILEFVVEESPDNGGRYCLVYEAETAGPNPGRKIGDPFWLADDVVNRIVKMDRRATSHALEVFTQFDDNAEEAGSLMRHGVVDLLLAMIKRGFRADCMTIKEKHRMDVLFDWFEILTAIVKTNFFNAATICASLQPVLKLFRAPVGVVPEIEYYGTTNNYFVSLAKLFKIISGISKSKAFWRDDAFFEFACGAVFWHLDKNAKPECHDALSDVSAAGSEFIRHELYSRAVEYEGRSLEFTAQLLSIANMRVCPDDSTFSSSMFDLVKETPTCFEDYLVVLRIFVRHDCVDRDMIRNIVELVGLTSCYLVGCRDCVYILGDALSASDDHHGSRDRRMSIAVDTGLIELILKMVEDEDDGEDAISDALKWIVDLLEQGATRGSKLCLSIARVDVEELMQLSVVDVDGSFSHRIKQLVESARELCTRTCTCCAASLGVGRIFRCDKCGTVYCSRVCQTKDWTKGGHKKTCSGYDGGHNGRGDRGGYDRGAPQVIAAYGARSTLRTLEELIALQDGSMFEDSEDNDSRFSDDSVAGGIQVEGCGLSEINGYFRRVGFHDDCPKFCKMTTFRGREEVFSLFRCRLTDNTRRWYISIVPMNSQPGTTKDVDFYAAPALSHDDYPPAKSWMSVPHGGGIDPPPTLTFAI